MGLTLCWLFNSNCCKTRKKKKKNQYIIKDYHRKEGDIFLYNTFKKKVDTPPLYLNSRGKGVAFL